MNEELKQAAADAIERRRGELVALSARIHSHPELSFEEVQSAAMLVEACKSFGWNTRSGLCDLPTAWDASLPESAGPTVAFVSEYDALPEIGHACGHNIIATAPIGALLGIEAVKARLHGQARVIGTPAEEGGGGKVLMADRGGFSGVDAAMLVHPTSNGCVRSVALACQHIEVEFHGRPAHAAASPERGVNALNAMILSFNHIDALRQHIRQTSRIHGIITHGGAAPNIVPDHTKAIFIVRATENAYLDQLMEKVMRCFEAGALATGCTYESRDLSPRYETVLSNPTLSKLYFEAINGLGVDCPMDSVHNFGSTDMGNVSWRIPSIHPLIKIADGVPNHTREFTAAAISERGHEAMIHAAKAMAFTAIDLLVQPSLLAEAKREFDAVAGAGG